MITVRDKYSTARVPCKCVLGELYIERFSASRMDAETLKRILSLIDKREEDIIGLEECYNYCYCYLESEDDKNPILVEIEDGEEHDFIPKVTLCSS